MPFNYYHATDIPDSLYDEIIQSHYPEGFDQAYRADKLREIIKTYSISRAQYWLDLGCGLHSLLSEAEGDNGAVIHLLDPNPEARKSYETYKDDFKNTKLVFSGGIGEKLPYKDHMFGFIYCGG
ncbi:class I SAM-dependent methyltransferase, partial [Aduncisulcus paluster]